MKNHYVIGAILALLAALLNGSVGIISKNLFMSNLTSAAISFYKCLFAFLFISIAALFHKGIQKEIRELRVRSKQLIICSFLGIFILYYFETAAYQYDQVSIVVFILLGTSALTTFLCGAVFLREKKNMFQMVGLVLLIAGLLFMHMGEGTMNFHFSIGTLLAIIAGMGYGLFLVATKKFDLKSGLALVWYFTLFGSIYLFFPFVAEGFVLPQAHAYPSLIALALLPTIGGFYCTTKALNYLKANQVQFYELTEPIFATLFAFILLKEMIKGFEWLGAILILLAIYTSEYQPKQAAVPQDIINRGKKL
ncbi:DMT family transporter [Bacillus spizizenii]|uniref:DMT family transporter n=1 Tax=Bacillus spizizenii TaxID=96241 RepID=UPI0030D2BD9A